MDTSRIDGVKAPPHDGTPRYTAIMSGNQSRSISLTSAPLSMARFIAVVSPRWAMRFRALAWRDHGLWAAGRCVLLGVAMLLAAPSYVPHLVVLGLPRASAAGRYGRAASSRALASCVARVCCYSKALSSQLVVLGLVALANAQHRPSAPAPPGDGSRRVPGRMMRVRIWAIPARPTSSRS